jgi:ABC-type polar amino acid transport system ATPase subunit/5S rRNA maturation endonuclease (ribonuclease M5)
MFKHLVISGSERVPDTSLCDLGRVNVICGRNNSGKSTLLQTLMSDDLTQTGKTFTEEDVDTITRECLPATGWRGLKRSYNDEFSRIVSDVSQQKQIWSSGEYVSFYEAVTEQMKASRLIGEYGLQGPTFVSVFRSLFPWILKTVLIPAKRQLELYRDVESAQPIEPSGLGVLNFLFFAKNQLVSTPAFELFTKIRSAFEHITGGFTFDVLLARGNALTLVFGSPGKRWISADSCGLGLQELPILLYFALAADYNVVLIEEPENHLHPEMQRKLLHIIRDQENKQFFLATHSNVFLDTTLVDRVFFTSFSESIHVADATSRATILNDLGYEVTDNLVSDLVVLVEGPSDSAILRELLAKKGLLSEYVIKIWPLGGDIMDQLDLSVFAERYQLIALLDRDPSSERIRRRFMDRCRTLNIPVHRLARYSIENYFSVRALRAVLKGQVPEALQALDPSIPVEKQLGGVGVKGKNRRIVEVMTLDEIAGTDLAEFLDQVETLVGERA